MRDSVERRFAVLLTVIIAVGSVVRAAQPKPQLFSFHSNAWLNLHHYVRSNARGGPAPTGLTDEERAQWAAGVEFYKPYVPRELTLDDGMIAIKNALRGAEGKTSLDGIAVDAALRTELAFCAAAPIENTIPRSEAAVTVLNRIDVSSDLQF